METRILTLLSVGVTCLGLIVADIDYSFARGGGRGGGGGGVNRSVGGGGGRSFSGGGVRSAAPTSISRAGGGNRVADAGNRVSNGDRVNNGNRINTGDINVNGRGWGGYYDNPVAAGVVTGAVVGATAAAVGSTYYDVPAGCPPVSYGGSPYYSCGGAYYQPQYEGTDITYVAVNDPSHG